MAVAFGKLVWIVVLLPKGGRIGWIFIFSLVDEFYGNGRGTRINK